MSNQTHGKLPCYGITAKALQILTGSKEPEHAINPAWFNWTHDEVSRLTVVQADEAASNSMARWSMNGTAAGYHCVLIDAVDDDHCIDDIDDLADDIDYLIVSSMNGDTEDNFKLLKQLREPERSLVIHYDTLREGGGVYVERLGFECVTFTQWLSYGRKIRDWIDRTAGDKATDLRIDTPDFSAWNPWANLGFGENLMLNLSEHFDTPRTDTWRWNVGNPITKEDVPNLDNYGVEAFWPMRQMPFCGVAKIFGGELRAIGALPNRKVNGNWLWDDGSIFNALSATAVVRESLLQKVLRSLNSSNVEVSSWRFPTRGRASSHGESGRHELENGEIVEINWNDDMIEVSHVRTSGTTHDLWLIAVADTPDGGEMLGSWKYAVHDQVFSPGINSRHQKVNITFIISSTEFRGI